MTSETIYTSRTGTIKRMGDGDYRFQHGTLELYITMHRYKQDSINGMLPEHLLAIAANHLVNSTDDPQSAKNLADFFLAQYVTQGLGDQPDD